MYLVLALPTTGKPFGSIADPNGKILHLLPAAGVDDHYQAAAKLPASRDFLNMAIHDRHKETHGMSEIFDAADIDFVVERRTRVKLEAARAKEDRKRKTDKSKPSVAGTPDDEDSTKKRTGRKGKTNKRKGEES